MSGITHVPAKACPGLDPGWAPVRGQEHASALTPRIHLDPDGTRLTIEHVQDVEAILARNRALRGRPQRSDWGRHIASIPNVILVKWMNEEGANVLAMAGDEFGKFLRRKLDDPDWRHLRTDK
jgi:hypothetical protein